MAKENLDKYKLPKAIIGILVIWLVVALLRTLLNIGKTVEDSKYFFVDDVSKRNQLFTCYPIVTYLKNKIDRTSAIALFSNDGYCFFTLRYYLYPSHVYWSAGKSINKNAKYDFSVVFGNEKEMISNTEKVKVIKINKESVSIYK
jgi:hypothetical protein